MAKSVNQRGKLLHIADILSRETDENHPMSMATLLGRLNDRGIPAERKSAYRDLEALRGFGMEITAVSGGRGGYYLAERTFEVPELKLLADAAASSKFVTEKKTLELAEKLMTLTSVHHGQDLKRQLYAIGRAKNVNETIYYHVDTLHQAIKEQVKIKFRYFHYTAEKKKTYTNNGELRTVSPYALCWDDENYYLVAYNPVRDKIVHFRVDRMEQVTLTDESMDPIPVDFSIRKYIGQQFGMFAGNERDVTLRFDNSLAEVVLDRFGKDVFMIPSGPDRFELSAKIHVGPPFYGWVFQFGRRAELLSPPDVRQEFKTFMETILEQYKETKSGENH